MVAAQGVESAHVWMFQYRLKHYDLLREVEVNGARTEPWQANQHRKDMSIGQIVYFFRAASDHAPSAAIVAVGHIASLPFPHDCGDPNCFMVTVMFDSLIDPPFERGEIKSDAVLSNYYPYAVGANQTNFLLPVDVARRTREAVQPRLRLLEPEIVAQSVFSTRVTQSIGQEYSPGRKYDPIVEQVDVLRDPHKLARAIQSHSDVQNAVAIFLRTVGLEPRSPRPDEPNFDLAWSQGNIVFVVEVKSLTKSNEESQLRLGLGQVLWYRHVLSHSYSEVRAVLIPEYRPTDERWCDLCANLDVALLWPNILEEGLHILTDSHRHS